MSGSASPDQALAEHMAAMGNDLGELYTKLSDELTWLYWRWQQYVRLYGTNPGRLEILNASAPFFFYVVQQTLWYETLLGITRLAGPEKTGNKHNLSVHRVSGLIADKPLRQEVEQLLAEIRQASAFAIEWRNRHIAHRDLALSLGHTAKPLPEASKEKVDAAVDAIAALLNRLSQHYLKTTTAYRASPLTRDAEELLYVLRDGLRREEIRQKRLEGSGEYLPEDWNDDLPPI